MTTTGATLNGTVNPNGASTAVHFEYGVSTYSSTTPEQTFTGTLSQNVSADIGGLMPGTQYHFRIVGTNSNGSATGSDLTFTTATPTPPPTVCTLDGTLGTAPVGGATGTLSARLVISFLATTCVNAPYPGNTGTGPYIYNVHYITNNTAAAVCTNVTLHMVSSNSARIAAFQSPFLPGDISNSARYLGDTGFAAFQDFDKRFSVSIPAGASVSLVVFSEDVSPGNQGAIYQIFLDQDFCASTMSVRPPLRIR